MPPRLTALALAAAVLSAGCYSNSGTAALSLRMPALVEQELTRVTLAVPCGVGAVVVGDEVYETHTYSAPTDALRDEWGYEQAGWLRRTSADTLSFVADDSTVRIQFFRSTLPENGQTDFVNQRCP